MSRLLLAFAQFAYAARFVASQVSAWATVPACMSLSRFGMTNETVGRLAYSDRALNASNGTEYAAGTLVKFTQGACLRAYLPELHAVAPTLGRSSEKPANVYPAASSSEPRFGAAPALTGQASEANSKVLPANSAR